MLALADSGFEVANAVVHPDQVAGIHPPFDRLQPLQVRAPLGLVRIRKEVVGFVAIGAGLGEDPASGGLLR